MKYFVISDIHNCYDETVSALKNEGFDALSPDHKVIFLGDAFEKGNQPVETYFYLKRLIDIDKLIWARGNHDMELVNAIMKKKLNKTNRSTATAIAKFFTPNALNTDEAICNTLLDNGFVDFIIDNSRDYFELDKYVFVHGYIPLNKKKYDENWRTYPSEKWSGARKAGAVKAILRDNIRIPGKTVVSGHVGAYLGHIVERHPDIQIDSPKFKKIVAKVTREKSREYYETYYGDGVIAMDANAYTTGFMNCIVIEN